MWQRGGGAGGRGGGRGRDGGRGGRWGDGRGGRWGDGRGGRGGGGRRPDYGQSQATGVQPSSPAMQSFGGRGAWGPRGRDHESMGRDKAPYISGVYLSTPSPGSSQSVVPAPAFAPAGPSSAAPSAVDSDPMEALSREVSEKLQIAPAKADSMKLRSRPGFGRAGRKIMVRANHFLVGVADRDLYHYDVAITPEVTKKETNRLVMDELVKVHGGSHLGLRSPAYDGRKSLYTAGALPFESKEFLVNLPASALGREKQFRVAIKLASRPNLYHLQQFLRQQQMDAPYETIQALDVILRMGPSQECVTVGRSFFHPGFGRKGDLDNGVEYWSGYYQSVRLTQMGISLNIDVSARSFYEPALVDEFIRKYLNIREFSRPLSDTDYAKVKKVLKSVKVELTHGKYPKAYRISNISRSPISQLTFTLDDQTTKKSVVQYFLETYNYRVKYPSLPAVQAGSDSKPVYFPMELCRIAGGQRYTKRLNPRQVTNLLRATCQRPRDREGTIKGILTRSSPNKSKLVSEEFGMEVDEQLAMVEARVLPPPLLRYHETSKEAMVEPRLGQWSMFDKKMIDGSRVDHWTCVNFSRRMDARTLQDFCRQLIGISVYKGMQFNPQPVIPFFFAPPEKIEDALNDIHQRSKQRLQAQQKTLQLLIIILPEATGSYGKIKRICETELGIVSQCCQPSQAAKLNRQYMENVALKMNVKVGGRNAVLNDAIQKTIPLVCDHPTIIIGADVTHPQPGEDSSPSIAAVVASMDWPEITKYRGLVSAQAHREEIIQDLYKLVQDPEKGLTHTGMIREHLLAFHKSTGLKPQRIIFYRDGVSEGQFSQVLFYEMEAIRKACSSIQEGYLPPVTFVVVQKRHHTRLFPAQHGSRDLTDRSGNILPGTVVDAKICHPIEFDFYLNSHAGIQGTSRPAHYHVLFDENGFSADALQIFTNNLCYTYARCTRSVSIVPPVYYAHLAAFRARYYMENEAIDGASSGGRSRGPTADIRSLPAIKDNVKDVMFFC